MTLILLEPSTLIVVPLGSDSGNGKTASGLEDWAKTALPDRDTDSNFGVAVRAINIAEI